MKAVVVESVGHVSVRDVPEPTPGPYQVLTRTLSCGLCGTDKRIVAGEFYRRTFPGILGHEAVGRVIVCGEKVSSFSVGDLVLRTTAVYPDGELGGMSSLLGGLAELGLATDWEALRKDHPEVAVSPWWLSQQKLPREFDPSAGGMLITLKEVLSWADQVSVGTGLSVAVVGLGPVGLTLVRVCKLRGASPVVALGRRPGRLALARQLGADAVIDVSRSTKGAKAEVAALGTRFDVILDTSGDRELMEALPAALREFGRLGIYSVPKQQQMTLDWSWGGDAPRNWTVVFRSPREHEQHEQALDCLRLGFIDMAPFLTHKLSLEDFHKAWAVLQTGDGVKVTIVVGS